MRETRHASTKGRQRGETRCAHRAKFVQSRVDAHMRVASAANTSMANKDYGPATVSTIFVEWIGLNHVLSYVHLESMFSFVD